MRGALHIRRCPQYARPRPEKMEVKNLRGETMSREMFFFTVFAMMCLQMFLSVIQVKRYHREIKKLKGTGIIGIGHTKGGLKSGQIILISYDTKADRVTQARRMKGITIFAGFTPLDDYVGLTLKEIRAIGIEQDAKEFKQRRKKHPYDPQELIKKKGALIQAVEAIDRRLADNRKKLTLPKRSRGELSFKS